MYEWHESEKTCFFLNLFKKNSVGCPSNLSPEVRFLVSLSVSWRVGTFCGDLQVPSQTSALALCGVPWLEMVDRLTRCPYPPPLFFWDRYGHSHIDFFAIGPSFKSLVFFFFWGGGFRKLNVKQFDSSLFPLGISKSNAGFTS